jgi:hypothetical protein
VWWLTISYPLRFSCHRMGFHEQNKDFACGDANFGQVRKDAFQSLLISSTE